MTSVFIAPRNREILTVSVAYTVTVNSPADTSLDIYENGVFLGAATGSGGDWTYSYTPGSIATSVSLTAVGNVTGISQPRNITVAEANTVSQNIGTWSRSGTTVTAGQPDYKGGTSAFLVQPNASGTVIRRIFTTASAVPSDSFPGLEFYVKPFNNFSVPCLYIQGNSWGCAIDLRNKQRIIAGAYITVVEEVNGWWRIQIRRSLVGTAWDGQIFINMRDSIATATFTNTPEQLAAGQGFYIMEPRVVGSCSLPFEPLDQLGFYYESVDANGVETWRWAHPYQNSIADTASTGLTCQVIKPDGWTQNGTYKVLYALRPQIDAIDVGNGYKTIIETVLYTNIHNIHNLVVVMFNSRSGQWYASFADGTRNSHGFIADILTQAAIDNLGASSNPKDHLLVGYSKSGWAAISLILRNPNRFRHGASFDHAYTYTWLPPISQIAADMDTQAQWDLYNPKTILPSKIDVIKGRGAFVLYGSTPTFAAGNAELLDDLDAAGALYYFNETTYAGSDHNWGWDTWFAPAIAQLVEISNAEAKPQFMMSA